MANIKKPQVLLPGLRLRGEGRSGFPDRRYSTIGYGFEEVMTPIQEIVADYHWILDGTGTFHHRSPTSGRIFTDFDDHYEQLIIQETDFFRLTKRGYLTEYAEFVLGDWDTIYGVEHPVDLTSFETRELPFLSSRSAHIPDEFIHAQVRVIFDCVDAAFWAVFSQNRELLRRIEKKFPSSEAITWEEKYW